MNSTPETEVIETGEASLKTTCCHHKKDKKPRQKTSRKRALHEASREGKYLLVDSILEKGAKIDRQNSEGVTALHEACWAASVKVVETLLTHGANANIQDQFGETPLHVASICRKPEIIDLVLQHGGDINKRSHEGQTPLHLACCGGDENAKVVEFLLSKGVDVDVQNADGDTPLHIAVSRISAGSSAPKLCKMLLEKGAKIDVRNNKQKTPYDSGFHIALFQLYGIKRILDTHILKLNIIGLPPKIYLDNTEFDYLNDLKTECFAEKEKIINTKLTGNFSLYNLFAKFKNPWYLRDPVRFQELEETLESTNFVESYPLFASIMRYTFKQTKKRLDLLTKAFDSFDSEQRKDVQFRMLPDIVRRNILDFLSEDDLTNFYKSG